MPDTSPLDAAVPKIAAQLDDLFAPWNRSDAPGIAVGVVKDGATIFRKGFGLAHVDAQTPMTPSTKIRIGSTSKHFTALLALLLAEDGKLDLDVPIRTYIPELTGPGGDPSIRLLLQHRGGSRCYLDLGFIARGSTLPPLGRSLALQVRQTGRNFDCGSASIYNNGGYHLTSLAIERVGGASFEAQLKARLFDPAGLTDTLLLRSDYDLVQGMAACHVMQPGGGWRRGVFPTHELLGEGGLASTVDDMIRWTAALRARKAFGSRATWEALTERPLFPDGPTGPYALGMMVGVYRGAAIMHHAGGVIGGAAQMLMFAEHGLDVVILTNGAAAADPTALAERVADIVLGAQLTPPNAPPKAVDHNALLGDWWSAETGMLYGLCDDGGVLKVKVCGMPRPLPLEALSGGGALMSLGSIGETVFELPSSSADALIVRFGGIASRYARLDPASSSLESIAARIAGRYRSDDADCTATIALTDSGFTIETSDGHGTVSRPFTMLSGQVANSMSAVGGIPFAMVIDFEPQGPLANSFRITTTRTRQLTFQRIS